MNGGLKNFQIKPKGLKHEELFEHIIWFREIQAKKESNISRPNTSPPNYLQVELSEDNRRIFEFKHDVLAEKKNTNTKQHIIKDTSGKYVMLKIACQKLDAIGNIKLHSVFLMIQISEPN